MSTRVSSRKPCVKGPLSVNSVSGSDSKLCRECVKSILRTKEVVKNGLRLIRIRFGLPNSELPDLEPSQLGRFLSYLLLQGKERTPVAFPRRQRLGENGLCNLQRLCRRDRWELAHSVNSVKRNLPSSCRWHTPSARPSWEKNAFSNPPPPSDEFLQHVRRVCTRLFPSGWDRRYHSFVGQHVPNPSARMPPKSRSDILWKGRRGEFFSKCTSEVEVPHLSARYKEVMSAGKCRPLVIYDENIDLLGPLHKLVYNRLMSEDWLLCGPPTSERMASVCVNEWQTSVDLVAATDNLPRAVAETILDRMFWTSTKVPRTLRKVAFASLSPKVRDARGIERFVTHGQMMGGYLSFPLLCIQSYCAASFAARFDPNATFLVNGDDCVISASAPVSAEDYPSGFILNDSKTIRSKNVVEVNSTAFLAIKKGWREVRHLRRGGALTDFEGMIHMGQACSISPAWSDAFVRSRIGKSWGFLPSQLGLHPFSHASYKRRKQMTGQGRYHTELPSAPIRGESSLIAVHGRRLTPEEAEATRSELWNAGREGGMKREVYNPSRGVVRRSFGYATLKRMSYLSFGSISHGLVRPSKARHVGGFIPEWFVSREEVEREVEAEEFRRCFDNGDFF